MANLTGWHLIVVLVVILLLFGATRLPALSKSLGQSIKIFRKEVKPEDRVAAPQDEHDAAGATPPPSSPAAQRSATPVEPGASTDKP
jgi:sec-independent protein translocase protein TatA